MLPNIILVGNAGSGKDTVGSYLKANYRYRPMSLATPIKQIASNLFYSFGYRDTDKTKYRNIWTGIGEEMRRLCKENFGHEDVWNHQLISDMRLIRVITDDPIVITDGRYVGEVEFFSSRGFIPVLIKSTMDVVQERITVRDGSFNEEAFKHRSETEIAELKGQVRLHLVNNTTLNDLYSQIDNLIHSLDH